MLLLVFLLPSQAVADDFMQKEGNYKSMIMGIDKVQFTLPTQYDGNMNEGVSEGHVYLTVDGGPYLSLFDWRCANYRDLTSDEESGSIIANAYQDGTFMVVGKVTGGYKTFTNGYSVSYTVGQDDDNSDHFSSVIEWTVPRSMRGHKLKFYVWAHIEDRDRNWYIPTDNSAKTSFYHLGDWDCPSAPEVSVNVSEPMLAFDKEHVNQQMFTYSVSAKSIEWIRLHYTDNLTGRTYTKELDRNKLADIAYMPADHPFRDVYIEAKVVDGEGNNVTEPIQSDRQSTNMLHYPDNLKAMLMPTGEAYLTWHVANSDLEDAVDGDFFEIQRNLSGSVSSDDVNWITISAAIIYESGKSSYSFTDESLPTYYTGKGVAYRIRRGYTAMWQWADNSGYDIYQLASRLVLPWVLEPTVQRGSQWDDDGHQVDFTFRFNGPQTDSEGRRIIRDQKDWETFAQLVNGGQTDLKAVLGGDVDINLSQAMVGTAEHPYSGEFNGNGYTLKVNFDAYQQWIAPFSYVQGATIKNLAIDGTIRSRDLYLAGLVACVKEGNDSTFIENCRVSAILDNSYNSTTIAACMGGFIGQNESARLAIRNCRFDGQLLGEKCFGNGGFVGNTTTTMKFENCLFAPAAITTMKKDCMTFARGHLTTTENSFYTILYSETITIDNKPFLMINNVNDWDHFRELVNSARGQKDVDAILMADISVTEPVASDAAPYRGTFDGNGHTLDVNLWDADNWGLAPFRIVGDVTIRNLHVTGKVIAGKEHASGLIGARTGTPEIHIEKVWVSTYVSSAHRYVGGIIGHAGGANVYISDTRFDGTLSASKEWYDNAVNAQRHNENEFSIIKIDVNQFATYGGIIGWGGEGGWNFHRVYDYGSANNVYWYFYCIDSSDNLAHISWGGNDKSTLTVTRNSWSNVNYYNKSDQEEVVNLMNSELPGSWHIVDGKAVPVLDVTSQQGVGADELTASELAVKLGKGWEVVGCTAQPVFTHPEGDIYGNLIWDQRAKLQLRVNMHGENGIESNIIDLTGNEDAIKNQQFTQELTRKCVDYSFDFIVKRNKSILPIIGLEVDSLVVPVVKTDSAALQDYRFMNNGRITKLTSETRQSSVALFWEMSTGDFDFFRVLRRKHTNDANAAWTDTIATDLRQLFYEDKKVLAQQVYDYKVESVYQCEGTTIDGKTCTGACAVTGMISGYVRMSDGTAMGGAKVFCEPDKDAVIPGARRDSTYTDDTGYFEFKGLPFHINSEGVTDGHYVVTVEGDGTSGSYTAPNGGGMVTFDQNSNWAQDFNFWMDTYFIFSGNVYYDGTSMPVQGVSFKMDGNVMHDASQRVITTDTQGAFTLSIPAGEHDIQAVKDGHVFLEDGFLVNNDAIDEKHRYKFNFNKNVSQYVFWDSTTVILRGRVIGGSIEGDKPLGSSLSLNNLGDSIKIVMQLEGDNASWMVRDQKDATIKSRNEIYTFGAANKDTTRVNITRHAMTIRPDGKTGEYQLKLHPAKYKVIEVSAQGYATLFQAGKVGETLDLAFNVKGDTCVYNRIYHAVPDLEVTQYNPRLEPYYGTKKTTATDNIGNVAEVELWGYNKDSIPCYSFGYPVFMANSPYGWMLQACEKYYWNNKPTEKVDIVKLNGGSVLIKNYMVSNDESKLSTTLELDSMGYASYVFTPANTTNVLEDEMALRSVDITLNYDGNYYDIKPLDGKLMKGFVMATTPKKEGAYTVAASYPILIDVLRDPPGSNSSSYIEAGSKLSYSYSPSFEGSLGVSMSVKNGTYSTIYQGSVLVNTTTGAGSTNGTVSEANSDKTFSFSLSSTFNGSWSTSYTLGVTERIQTKTGQLWVGPKADLFMGTNESMIIQDAIAVRAIPEEQYLLMKNNEGGTFTVTDSLGNTTNVKVKLGAMKVLARGTDTKGKSIYLVRDEVMGVTNRVNSTFIHSQYYIEEELLPNLAKLRNSLIHPKGAITEPQALADQTGKSVYVSKVDVNDPFFGATDNVEWYHAANDLMAVNEVKDYNQQMGYWINMLAENEMEKLTVQPNNLVKNYDFDGGTSVQYSESFSASRNKSGFIKWPGLSNLNNIANMFPDWALGTIQDLMQGQESSTGMDENNQVTTEAATATSGVKIKFTPILGFNYSDVSSENKANTKTIGFTLSVANKASMNVDVYRTRNGKYGIDENTPDPMLEMTKEVLDELRYGEPYHPDYDMDVYSSFVFHTRGGVTCKPYEGERRTKWYQPGTVLDPATISLDNLRIWVEEPVKSNVPFDEPARFVLHMANESNYPTQATVSFKYYLDSGSNPKGATVRVDGKAINASEETVWTDPIIDPSTGKHNVITKEIAVYPSTAYDYENLTISLYDPEDFVRIYSTNISAHFIPSAGKVKVTVPGDKWVINTESPYDSKRQSWYMPVRIEGFDVNFPNFDHIELQYKLSTQGDKDWVNVCSYYADEALRAKASGVTDSIPSSGIIVAPFYGEVDPIEQYYDIRAVNYCRYGAGFLTRSSEILTGIKDTRPPHTFGTPEPVNGILGIGDDIKIAFSEAIAGNYLRSINNFEVLGQPASNSLSTSTSLAFEEYSSCLTEEMNLTGKSFTFDIMVNPMKTDKPMLVIGHGLAAFGLTADRHLVAVINGTTVTSTTAVDFNNVLHRIAYVVEQNKDDLTVHFYDGDKHIGQGTIPGIYQETGNVYLGYDLLSLLGEGTGFKGDMLDFRIWNRALSSSELSVYKNKTLTGYEIGLLSYYLLNEGEGDYSYDRALSGNDLHCFFASWKRPKGISLKVNGQKGIRMKATPFERSKEHDYTLMFWFKSENLNATFMSNGEATNRDISGKFNISHNENTLYFRSSGYEVAANCTQMDFTTWHHYAMTVSRSRNVANIYIDCKLVASVAADSLSGITGDEICLGATYVDKNTEADVMKGNIDEVAMFSSVLPLNLIETYAYNTPSGRESALIAYLPFEASERDYYNQMQLVPTGVSLKRYIDNQNNESIRRDTLVAVNDEMADKEFYAPMRSKSMLENLKYSFVAKDNELLVQIDEPDFLIEKTNLYVTVKEVADLNGNLMESPVTLNLYVYRNPLRWNVKRLTRDVKFGEGATFEATISNVSGQTQTFELIDLPYWMTASKTTGTIPALDEETITFTVQPYINIGTYNEQVTLLCDNKMAEPLPIKMKVRGEEPDWTVSDDLKKLNLTMQLVAQVKIEAIISNSEEDILGVFDSNGQVLGVTHIDVDNQNNAGQALAYVTVYGYKDPATLQMPTLQFKFFQASTGKIYLLQQADGDTTVFEAGTTKGSAVNPLELVYKGSWNNYNSIAQTLYLKKGWNWISFNVRPQEGTTVGQLLYGAAAWEPNDVIEGVSGNKSVSLLCRKADTTRGYRWTDDNKVFNINPQMMYRVYSGSDKMAYITGKEVGTDMTVFPGWNRLGYTTSINLPITQAMSNYVNNGAKEGDVLKSQDAFAILSHNTNGDLIWKGSLHYLETGKGYMLKHNGTETINFRYPFIFEGSRYVGSETKQTRRNIYATSMNIVATVSGVEMEAGDHLVVYRGTERCCEAVADADANFYLNIGGAEAQDNQLLFCIERDGELLSASSQLMRYEADKVLGTPDEPTVIDFIHAESLNDGSWYTTAGIKLNKKPTRSGVYIHNGKAVVIK
jgi:hypothetical protein